MEDRNARTSTVTEIERYQVETLGTARDRLTDEDNPPDQSELEGINTRIEAAMPTQLKELDVSLGASSTSDNTATLTLDIPKL